MKLNEQANSLDLSLPHSSGLPFKHQMRHLNVRDFSAAVIDEIGGLLEHVASRSGVNDFLSPELLDTSVYRVLLPFLGTFAESAVVRNEVARARSALEAGSVEPVREYLTDAVIELRTPAEDEVASCVSRTLPAAVPVSHRKDVSNRIARILLREALVHSSERAGSVPPFESRLSLTPPELDMDRQLSHSLDDPIPSETADQLHEVTYADENARIAWEVAEAIKRITPELPADATPSLVTHLVSFSEENEVRGTYALFIGCSVGSTDEEGVFEVSDRALQLLEKLEIPYERKGAPASR